MKNQSAYQSFRYLDLLNIVFLLALATCFSGCQSTKSKAEDALEKGDFLTAAGYYEELLSSDKNDAEAKEGLQKARQQLLQARLIKVRMARLGKNYEAAFQLLASVIQDENNWGISPQNQAFATQKEELNEVIQWISTNIKNDINAGFPLKAHLDLEQRKKMLLLNNEEKEIVNLEDFVLKEGRRHCQSVRSQIAGHFSSSFANKYCNYWGLQIKPALSPAEMVRKYPKISGIKLEGHIQGLPKELQVEISNAILKGLQKTPYFGSGGTLLPVVVQGSYVSSYEERPTIQTHFYEVQIPYQDFQTETYTVDVPYTDYQSTFDPQLGQYVQKPQTKYRPETRTRQVAVTKYRPETRSLTYGATEYNLHYELLGTLNFNLENQAFTIPMNEQLSLHDFFHNTSNRELGLAAKVKNAPEPIQWLREKLTVVPVKTEDMVRTHWTNKYCNAQGSPALLTATEGILTCAAGAKELPTSINKWANAKFGLQFNDLAGTIGL